VDPTGPGRAVLGDRGCSPGLKPCCGLERAPVRSGRAQGNPLGLASRAFWRLEHPFDTPGVSWYEAKARIRRGAVRAYIAQPLDRRP
jgi:putative transposase